MKKILKHNPNLIFMIMFIVLFIISSYLFRYLDTKPLIYIIIMDTLLIALYIAIRYDEYLLCFTYNKALYYLVFDNSLMITGVVLLHYINYFVYRGTGIINFFVYIGVIALLIPTFIRNKIIKQKWDDVKTSN